MKLRLAAPAKLNLVLEVLSRRADGFHEIRSVVQPIALFDVLEAEPARSISLAAPTSTGPVDDNLVMRAAHLLRRAAGIDAGARLTLQKRIPVGAGLGGGSSDAAAALRLLSRLWGIQPGRVDLGALAARLGSDVALFLKSGPALLSGRGEIIQSVPPLRSGYFVIVVPPFEQPNKTAAVYSAVRSEDFGDGSQSLKVAASLADSAALDPSLLQNGLEPAARRVFPGLAQFQRDLAARTATHFTLAGAGPALFSYLELRDAASALAESARSLSRAVIVARPLVGRCTIYPRQQVENNASARAVSAPVREMLGGA